MSPFRPETELLADSPALPSFAGQESCFLPILAAARGLHRHFAGPGTATQWRAGCCLRMRKLNALAVAKASCQRLNGARIELDSRRYVSSAYAGSAKP